MKIPRIALAAVVLVWSVGLAPAQGVEQDVRYLLGRAERLIAQLNYRFALEHLERAAKSFPEDPRVHVLMGECHFALEEHEDAVTDFRAGLKLAPALAARVPNYPFALLKLGRLDEAKAAYENVLETATDDLERAQGRYGLGLVALNRGDAETARAELEAAHAAHPGSEKINYRLGLLLRTEGRIDEAIPHLIRVVESDGLHEAAIHNLALAHAQKRDLEEARRWRRRHRDVRAAHERLSSLRLALRTRPGDPELLAGIATIYADHGCWSEAVGPWSAVAAARPTEAEPRYHYAVCLQRLGEWKQARQQLEQALRAEPDHEASKKLWDELVEKVHGPSPDAPEAPAAAKPKASEREPARDAEAESEGGKPDDAETGR